MRGHARAWSPRLSTKARQPGAPPPPHRARVRGRGKRIRRRSVRCMRSDASVVAGSAGWRRAMPLHVDVPGNAAALGRWAEWLAARPALGKKRGVREQHPFANHSPKRRAHHEPTPAAAAAWRLGAAAWLPASSSCRQRSTASGHLCCSTGSASAHAAP